MKLSVPISTMRLLGRALTSYGTNQPLALATALSIRNEALLRLTVGAQVDVGATMIGRETTARRRRHREAAQAAQFHAVSEARHGTRRPVVNWHEGGQGPVLLLLNGFTASGLVWPESWLRRLEKRYRVIRIDNRGTGWSRSAPHPFTIDDLADDARDVLRACGIDRATVLGLSMGGMIAQELAIRHAEVVEKLVLVGTRPPTPAQIQPDDDAVSLLLQRLRRRDGHAGESAFRAWAQIVGDGFATAHPDTFTEMSGQVLRRATPRSAVVDQARAIAAWHGPARLRRLRVPTTVVHGDCDRLVPVANGTRLAQLIPDASYVELPGVGHLVPHEAGDALLRVLDVRNKVGSSRFASCAN